MTLPRIAENVLEVRSSRFVADQVRRNRDLYAAPRDAAYIVQMRFQVLVGMLAAQHGRKDLQIMSLDQAVSFMRNGGAFKAVFDHEVYQFFDDEDWLDVYRLIAMSENVK